MNKVQGPLVILATVACLLGAACQPAATPVPPTVTAIPATETASPLPPTPTSTVTPVPSTATPTVAPTRTATPLPPVPTANFAPSDVVGTWHFRSQERGDLYITLSEDGTYSAAHGTVEGVVHHGPYTLDGRLFTFVSGWNCSPGEDVAGQYVLRLLGGGKWLYFDLYVDTCVDRPLALVDFRWDRVETP